jgi:hypothetical protein
MEKIFARGDGFLHPTVEGEAMFLYQDLVDLYIKYMPAVVHLLSDDKDLPDDPRMLQRLKERKLNKRDFQYQSHMELDHKPHLGIV